MKRIRLLAVLLVALVCVTAKSQITLPASEIQSLFNSDDKTIIDRTNVSWADKLTNDCPIDCINLENGNATFTIHFDGTPGMFEFAVCRNADGKNYNLTVEESKDNSNWNPEKLFSEAPEHRSDFNIKHSFLLNPETRYIRFTYTSEKSGGLWGIGAKYSRCHISNIKINKAISVESKEINASGNITEPISATISVNAENLKGDLIAVSDNPDITVTPERIAQSEAIGKTNIFTVTYSTETVESAVANISFMDEALENNAENVKVTFSILPSKPVATEATEIGSDKFTANWNSTQGFRYLLSVKKEEDILPEYDNIECEGNSMTVSGLEPGTTYTYTIKETNGVDISEESDAVEVTTKTPVMSISEAEDFITDSRIAVSQDFTVNAEFLAGDISMALLNGTVFSLDKNLIGPDEESKTFRITYTPSIYGEETDQLTISSKFCEDITVNLYGLNVLNTPVALDAENITNSGFTAKWEKVTDATDYLLTVIDENGEALVQYNQKSTGDTNFCNVNNLQPSTTYTYYLQAVNNEYVSEDTSNEINVTTAEGAVITISPEFKDFTTENNTTVKQTVNVSGTNVFSNITVTISGDNSFTCDNTTIPSEGGNITVTYSPTSIGSNSATLKLSAQGAETISLDLKGYSTPGKVTLAEAENITTNSFTAKWNETEGAESYLLTVYNGNNVLAEYNELKVEGATSKEITGLNEATYYNYSVKAVNGESVGVSSERMSVRTLFTPNVSMAFANSTLISIKWDEPFKADKYLVTLKKDGNTVADYNESETNVPVFSFSDLETSTSYNCQVSAVFGETKITSAELAVSTTAESVGTKQLDNSDFELWEGSGDTYEPVNWNSFGTGTGSKLGLAIQFAGIRMEKSDDVRPESKGTSSVRIWTGDAILAKANGNFTNGRINAGETTASDPKNYNFSDINDEAFSDRIGTRPDSLTVWVKYTAANIDSKARVSAIIHDNYSYRDPSGSDPESPNHVVATAELNFPSNGGNWQRLSIPFEYKGNSLSPDFLLISMTSNATPGGGDVNDALTIDDLHLVYKPSLEVGNPEKKSYKPGEAISLSYDITGSMSVPNINAEANTVSLQISDATGSFESATTLTSVKTNESGILYSAIPSDIPVGSNYRLRVVTTNYPMVTESSETFEIISSSEPRISYSGDTYFEAAIGGYSTTHEFTVVGENLEGEIFIKSNSKVFTVKPEVLPSEGGKISVTYAPTAAGEEEAELTVSSNGAESITVKLTGKATATTSIYSNDAVNENITVYPNPVIETANVNGVESDARFCIYSIDGRMIKAGRLVFSTADVSDLGNGIYFMVVNNKKIKFVK